MKYASPQALSSAPDAKPLSLIDHASCAGDVARVWIDTALLITDPLQEPVEVLLLDEQAPAVETSWRGCGSRSLKLTQQRAAPGIVSFQISSEKPSSAEPCSVVIPAHATPPDQLERCLKSIDRALEAMPEVSHEILVIDDASPEPLRLPEGIRTPARLIRLTEDVGPSVTRNVGVSEATSDCVFFVDSDDEVRSGFFSHLLNELQRGARMATCSVVYDDGNDKIFCAGPLELGELGRRNTCSVAIGFRKSDPKIARLIESGGLMLPERMEHFEDWEMHLTLARLGVARSIVPIPLYRYHRSPTGRNARGSELRFISEFQALVSSFQRADAVDSVEARKELHSLLEQLLQKVDSREKERLYSLRHFYRLRRLLGK